MYMCVLQCIFHLYAGIYRFRLIAFIRIYCTSSGQVHIQQSATNISYTDISLCTGSIHKNGIKIYAANSHYHQISRRKGLWQLPPPCPFTCMRMCQKLIGGRGRGRGMPGGAINIDREWDTKKKTKKQPALKIKTWFATALKKPSRFQMSEQHWKLCFSKQILKVTRIITIKSDTAWINNK